MLLGYRYYDASVGRFISSDPAKAGDNWYAYCHNNPLVRTDPVGLDDADKKQRGENHKLDPKQVETIKEKIRELTGQNNETAKKERNALEQKLKAHEKAVGERGFGGDRPIQGNRPPNQRGNNPPNKNPPNNNPPNQRGNNPPKNNPPNGGNNGNGDANASGGGGNVGYDPGMGGVTEFLLGIGLALGLGGSGGGGFGGGICDNVGPISVPVIASCFEAGTLVVMADGTLKKIEYIHAGDMVLSYDEQTGITMAKEVLYKSKQLNEEDGIIISLPDGETIMATANHPFYVVGRGFVMARDVTLQMELKLTSGALVQAANISHQTAMKRLVYNLTISDFHNYFVGKAGVLVRGLSAVPASRSNHR
jgi:hypothetical protein